MAIDQLLNTTPASIPAGSDLSASQYCAVTINSSGNLALASANGPITGILYNKPDASGRAGQVQCSGFSLWRLGGTVTAGDFVKADSTGRAVTASAGDVAAGYAQGQALVGGSANGVGTVLLLRGAGVTAVSGVQALTDSGTINATTSITTLAVTGTDAYTLSNGLFTGQRKIIRCISASGSPAATVTPTTVSSDSAGGTSPASFIMNAAGQEVELEWYADGWKIMRVKSAGTDAPTASTTLNNLVAVHAITIANTQDWLIGDGWCPGTRKTIMVASTSGSPVGTISGLFYDEDGSADGVDINLNAAADIAVVEWEGSRWVPITLTSATVS